MKKTLLKALALSVVCHSMPTLAALNFTSEQKNQLKGVRLTDATHSIGALKNLSQISQSLEKSWDDYVADNYDMNEVLNLFLTDIPTEKAGQTILPIASFGSLENSNEMVFIMADILVSSNNPSAINVRVKKVIPLSRTKFELNASLADRKLIVSDTLNDLKMVFPLGVGSFDEGVLNDAVTLLTPRFENSYLDKNAAISKRDKPRYFAGKPFLRITTDENPAKGHTAIGFHVQPNLDPFVRAFDSHGCMRMQTHDLQMLHDLLKEGPHRRLSVNVKFKIDDPAEHPINKVNKPYKKVLNVGKTSAPNYTIDRDGLVQTTKDWNNEAPVDRLQDIAGDHHHAIYDYDMSWREEERFKAHVAECYEQHPYDEVDGFFKKKKEKIKYNSCVKDGRRNNSLSDRLYQMWVH